MESGQCRLICTIIFSPLLLLLSMMLLLSVFSMKAWNSISNISGVACLWKGHIEHKCAVRAYIKCTHNACVFVRKGKWHSNFIGFRFCINFHRFFFISFHFVLLLLSSFMDSLLFFFSFTLSLFQSRSLHLLPSGARSARSARSICEIIQNNIWKSNSV